MLASTTNNFAPRETRHGARGTDCSARDCIAIVLRSGAGRAAKDRSDQDGGFFAGVAALVAIVLLPQLEGLSVAGQHMLGIFAFAVIVWMTEALDYAASSIFSWR